MTSVTVQSLPPEGGSHRRCVVFVAFVLCASLPALAQPAPSADEALIRQRLAKYAEARDAGDAHAEALCYTEDGDFRSSAGPFVTGRSAIEKQLTVNAPGYHFAITVESLRFVTRDVAIAEAKVAAGPAQTPAQLVGTYVLVRQANDWLISAARIARVMPAPAR